MKLILIAILSFGMLGCGDDPGLALSIGAQLFMDLANKPDSGSTTNNYDYSYNPPTYAETHPDPYPWFPEPSEPVSEVCSARFKRDLSSDETVDLPKGYGVECNLLPMTRKVDENGHVYFEGIGIPMPEPRLTLYHDSLFSNGNRDILLPLEAYFPPLDTPKTVEVKLSVVIQVDAGFKHLTPYPYPIAFPNP